MALSAEISVPIREMKTVRRMTHALCSRRHLQQALGAVWLFDGLLQLQPSMWTQNLVTGIMQPATQGQPAVVGATLTPMVHLASRFVVPTNATILLAQVAVGLCLLSGRFVRPALMVSVVWALGVWYWGEGLGMVLTGQASVLTGAPGAVLLYAVLGLAAYPPRDGGRELLSRKRLRWLLAA
ncbi:MAG TPA: hypothetical protein VKX16_09460, partial [Chloroflexota bacterium]|nr:hypothetical protein [Chloroflexota bacterium]